jgi:HAMP domain-containing protein
MIIICEECGKKYEIDPSRIKGRAAGFKCRFCTHFIVVPKPIPKPEKAASEFKPTPEAGSKENDSRATVTVTDDKTQKPSDHRAKTRSQPKTRRLGLRAKMIFLFLLVPMTLVTGASLLYLWQLENLSDLLAGKSSKIINRMAEKTIVDAATSAAMQCKLYLMSHPDLIKEDFNEDMGFKTLAVQKVGVKGYTYLYELPGRDGIWRTWAHVNPKIIGIDMRTLKTQLGKNFDAFWEIYSSVKAGMRSQGYYIWRDKDGKFRDKFMVCNPIAGTRFVIAATIDLDEFTEPIKLMRSGATALIDRAKLTTWAILGVTFLLIGAIVYFYGHVLAAKIKSLTEVAERISVGELATEIEKRSKDEIGDLAEAIARMQESIRLSIERLQRRKN